ncbi:hypothetical protein [Halothiobacillus diazotrophicus]|uniref:hypothetical protein n=1 Tax=Halothiobacillus diazotrophicus TaxID=1860122 RepID=UPI001E4BD9E5|nr:hypothetical protein [Halothiobacillus diazotrophicus]
MLNNLAVAVVAESSNNLALVIHQSNYAAHLILSVVQRLASLQFAFVVVAGLHRIAAVALLAEAFAAPQELRGDRGATLTGFRIAEASIEPIVGELAGVPGLLVGDLDQSVGGIPLVGVGAVAEQIAIGIVLVVGLTVGLGLIESVDGDGCSVNGLLGYMHRLVAIFGNQQIQQNHKSMTLTLLILSAKRRNQLYSSLFSRLRLQYCSATSHLTFF